MWVIIYQENGDLRPEVIVASKSKNKIIEELRKIKESFDEKYVFDYHEDDCLILDNDEAYYIEKINKII
jgi:alpha-ketoglutarate-dependent taurine dioxygenase